VQLCDDITTLFWYLDCPAFTGYFSIPGLKLLYYVIDYLPQWSWSGSDSRWW